MTDSADGIYELTRAEYDAIDRLRWSDLKVMDRSPAHFRHNLLVKRETTDALALGIATHIATYQPELFRNEVLPWEGNRSGGEWKIFEAANRERTILKKDAFDLALAMATAVRADKYAGRYVENGKAEQTVLWTYKRHDGGEIKLKSRLDFVSRLGALTDLKTARDGSIDKFGRFAYEYGYHGQGAFYQAGLAAVIGEELPYLLIAVEKAQPHVVQIHELKGAALAAGRDLYTRLLDRWWECREANRWPGYADGPVELELPRWAFDSDTDLEDFGMKEAG